jgi:hypothetical protein
MMEATGDLINYASPDKMYKRLGLACHSDGTAQGRPGSSHDNLSKEEKAADWIARGYSKHRRAAAHWVATAKQAWGKGDANIDTIFYKGVYWKYKQEYIAKDAKNPEGKATRKLIKYVLRHFYKAWWRDVACLPAEMPGSVPAATAPVVLPKKYPKKLPAKRLAG